MDKYKHNKTGNIYKVLAFNVTNKTTDENMVLYVKDNDKETNVLNQKKYVRTIRDFEEKFDELDD